MMTWDRRISDMFVVAASFDASVIVVYESFICRYLPFFENNTSFCLFHCLADECFCRCYCS